MPSSDILLPVGQLVPEVVEPAAKLHERPQRDNRGEYCSVAVEQSGCGSKDDHADCCNEERKEEDDLSDCCVCACASQRVAECADGTGIYTGITKQIFVYSASRTIISSQ